MKKVLTIFSSYLERDLRFAAALLSISPCPHFDLP